MSRFGQAFSGLLAAVFLVGAAHAHAAGALSRENEVVHAFRKAGPAVVSIRAVRVVEYQGGFRRDLLGPDFFNDFWFGPGLRQQQESLGSGVIINPAGYILTNQHVIEGANKIIVSLQSGGEVQAEVIGADYRSDLAVLKINVKTPLNYLPMGRSSELMIGETLIVIGNPFGLGHTLTVGVVSALHRRIQVNERVYGEFIQTDASINPGNSGGAVLNILGELVGITTAIYSKAQGIGFAIPIDKARRVVDDLIAFGEVTPGWLGIEVEDLTPELSSALAVSQGLGVMVSKVWPQSPAEKAGLKAGMVIFELDGRPAPSKLLFKEIMADITRNAEVSIRYFDRGREGELVVKASDFPLSLAGELSWELLGIEVSNISGGGVMVSRLDPNSPAGKLGLGRGDIILRMNQNTLSSRDDFYRALVRNRNQSSVIIVIKRKNIYYYVTLPLRG